MSAIRFVRTYPLCIGHVRTNDDIQQYVRTYTSNIGFVRTGPKYKLDTFEQIEIFRDTSEHMSIFLFHVRTYLIYILDLFEQVRIFKDMSEHAIYYRIFALRVRGFSYVNILFLSLLNSRT